MAVPITKARSLNLTGEMPIVDAAASSSLTAAHAIPAHSSEAASRKGASQQEAGADRKNHIPFIHAPKSVMRGMPPIPKAPPKKGMYRKTASTMKFIPIVVVARKSSLTRMLGSPRKKPIGRGHRSQGAVRPDQARLLASRAAV